MKEEKEIISEDHLVLLSGCLRSASGRNEWWGSARAALTYYSRELFRTDGICRVSVDLW